VLLLELPCCVWWARLIILRNYVRITAPLLWEPVEQFLAEMKNGGGVPPLPHVMVLCLIKHRDFTFYCLGISGFEH
jgi:hypothetical protein